MGLTRMEFYCGSFLHKIALICKSFPAVNLAAMTILEEVMTASITLRQTPETLTVNHGSKSRPLKKGKAASFIRNTFMLPFLLFLLIKCNSKQTKCMNKHFFSPVLRNFKHCLLLQQTKSEV